MDEQVEAPQSRYRDFDAAFAEAKEEPVVIRLYGEEEQLPAQLPAALVLEILRLQAAQGSNLREEDIFTISTKLFGVDRLNRWADKGLHIGQLTDLMVWTLQQYGVGAPEGRAGKKGKK